MFDPLSRRMMMAAVSEDTNPETYLEFLQRRYSQVESDGRLNWYLRANEAGHLAISLPGMPEVDLFDLARDFGAVQLNILPILRQRVRDRQTMVIRVAEEVDYQGGILGNAYASKAKDNYPVVKEVVMEGDHYETSSQSGVLAAFDMYRAGILPKGRFVICNGYFTDAYSLAIRAMRATGFETIIPVLDKPQLLEHFTSDPGSEVYSLGVRRKIKHGVRTTSEADRSGTRFGMTFAEIWRVAERIQAAKNTKLVMYHLHLGTQLTDEKEYLDSLRVAVEEYCQLHQKYETLHILDIGGGAPVPYSLGGISFDLERFWRKFLLMVKHVCREYDVPEPNILTEWGRNTVADYEMHLWQVIAKYDSRYQIAGTVMGTLPDYWGIGQHFLVLPVNGFRLPWDFFSIVGLTCDEDDEYSEKKTKGLSIWEKMLLRVERLFGSKMGEGKVPLPVIDPTRQPFYIVAAVTGAYQENIGMLEHCMQLEEAEITLDIAHDRWVPEVTKKAQTSVEMLRHMEFPV